MTVGYKEMQMIIEIEDQGRFGPKRDINKVVFLANHRWPNVKRVVDQASHRRIITPAGDFGDEIVNVGREDVENAFEELVMVKRPVKLQREAVAHCGVTYVKVSVAANFGENISGVTLASGGDVVVDAVSVDESYGEAVRSEFDG